MPLREHGTKPGGKAAATMEVAEERLSTTIRFAQAIELGVQRVSELSSAAGSIDRLGRSIEARPLFEDEVLPRRLVSSRARARERHVGNVQRVEVLLDLRRGGSRTRKSLGHAAL